jgi:hypothetical protein
MNSWEHIITLSIFSNGFIKTYILQKVDVQCYFITLSILLRI